MVSMGAIYSQKRSRQAHLAHKTLDVMIIETLNCTMDESITFRTTCILSRSA